MFKKAMKCMGTLCLAASLIGCGAKDKEYSLDPTKPIDVSGGKITGAYVDGSNNEVAVYKGIPYAASPVGDLRWQAPQNVEAWEGVKACEDWSSSAIQPAQAPFMMWSTEFIIEDTGYDEDCLSLNVWAKTSGDTNKPVVVYIHGGGYTSGGSSCEVYDGSYLASQDVVYVSINYRVGILGYLAHPDLSAESSDGVSGNYGLLDQIQALKWVQDHISKFGGDPTNVTIMGQSAGAGSVNSLVMSPLAKGLFNKAISMSFNSINSNMAVLADKEAEGKAVFGDKTLEEMRAMTPEELLALQYGSSPILDGVVLPYNYGEATKEGKVNNVTLMSGFVTGDPVLFGPLRTDMMTGKITQDELKAQVSAMFGDREDDFYALYPVTSDEEAVKVVNEFNVDNMIALQNALAKARITGKQNDTYTYHFAHVMPGPDAAMFGAFHTADVPYFLNVFSDLRKDYWTDDDKALGQEMSSYLINFARTGNPNGEGLVEWDANTNDNSQILNVPCEKTTLSQEKNDFFNAMYENLYK